jgi:hypothetical protein
MTNGYDGWIAGTQALVVGGTGSSIAYVSASSFAVTGGTDYTSVFQKGTRIKCTINFGTFYGVVVSSTYSAPVTTVTLAANDDYALTNTAITFFDFSYELSPQGYPGWFGYTPSFTASYSAAPTSLAYQFRVDGNVCTYVLRDGANGTSNSTTLTVSLPVTAATLTNGQWLGPARVVDNGTTQTTPGNLQVLSAGTTVAVFKDYAAAAFTNSGGKRIAGGMVVYPI